MTKTDVAIYLAIQINDKWDIPWASYGGEPGDNQLEFFNDILDLCEKVGMHPPIRKDISNLEMGNGTTTGICFGWEPEDETK
jgi:hypothetical protein